MRDLNEPVTEPDYSFPLALIETKVDMVLEALRKVMAMLEGDHGKAR